MKKSLLLTILGILLVTFVFVGCTSNKINNVENIQESQSSQTVQEAKSVLSKFSTPLDSTLYNEGILNVGYKTQEDLQRFAKEVNAEIITVVDKIKVAALKLNDNKVGHIIRNLRNYNLKGIDFVEPDYKIEIPVVKEEKIEELQSKMSINPLNSTPIDEWRKYQYALDLFDAESIWSKGYKGTGVVVAVVDTGVNGLHPDLTDRMLTGYNAKTDALINGKTQNDTNGHGSHCAGIIAAGIGGGKVIGLAPEAYIMPIGILGDYSTTRANIAAAIVWAVDNGAQVLNNSWGGPGYTHTLKRAIDYALSKGAVFVVSAGNDHSYQHWHYPAGYTGVIGVAASTANDRVVDFSSRGDYVSVAAPGTYILSTYHQNSLFGQPYRYMSGTSMAGPYVAAAAALLKQKYPQANGYQIKKLLELTAKDIEAPGYDVASGYGRINPKAALGLDPTVKVPDIDELQPAELEVYVTDRKGNPVEHVFVTIKERTTGRMYFEKTYIDSLLGDGTKAVARFKFIDPGTYDVYIGGPDWDYRMVNFAEEQLYYTRTVTLSKGETKKITQVLSSTFKIEVPKAESGNFTVTVKYFDGSNYVDVASGVVNTTQGFTYILPSSANPGKYLVLHNGGENVKATITINGNSFEVKSLAIPEEAGFGSEMFTFAKFSEIQNQDFAVWTIY